MSKQEHYRHGDISFHPVTSLPSKTKAVHHRSYIVAYGEATGHHHELSFDSKTGVFEGNLPAEVPANPKITVHTSDDGRRFVELDYRTDLNHPEHGLLVLEKGVYESLEKRTFDYFENSIKKVID